MPTKKTTATKETIPASTENAPVPAPATSSKPAPKKPASEKVGENAINAAVPAKKTVAPKTSVAPAKKAAPAKGSAQLTKVYGEIQASGNTFFIHKGSVVEGQLQLVTEKKELQERIPSYNGQFVTILGEAGKKKNTTQGTTFVIHNIASHDQIGRRAFELSHQNPADVEDNWFKAENELLS
jgi:hypothetical protein